jgi:hypothetical protein
MPSLIFFASFLAWRALEALFSFRGGRRATVMGSEIAESIWEMSAVEVLEVHWLGRRMNCGGARKEGEPPFPLRKRKVHPVLRA